jgi:pyridoxamine 5'-phosphate oxidase
MRGHDPEADDPNAGALDGDPPPGEPFPLLADWLARAFEHGAQREPNAIAVATSDAEGRPSVRVVLCRGLDVRGGSLVFYTNRESRKGRELEARPRAAAVFHWDALGRQARLEGPVLPVGDDESDAYFASRPAEAQLGAWASPQSAPIVSRAQLEREVDEVATRFGVDRDARRPAAIPRPPFWGGYRLVAERVELWASRRGRLHDRVLWTRRLESTPGGLRGDAWDPDRLAP